MIGSICYVHISNRVRFIIAEEDLQDEMFNLIIICVADAQLTPITNNILIYMAVNY